jgi:hypothetical protein
MSTDIIINENGTVRVFTKEHGDIQPKRHLVYVETSYPLPLHVELPYADNEMPQGEAAVRMSWIGPGVESKSVQCAFPITANGVVKLNIPSLDNVRETVVFVYPNVGYRLSLDANLKVSLDQLMGLLPLVKWLYQVVMLG